MLRRKRPSAPITALDCCFSHTQQCWWRGTGTGEQNPAKGRWTPIRLQCLVLTGSPPKMGGWWRKGSGLDGSGILSPSLRTTCVPEGPAKQPGRGRFSAVPAPSQESVSAHHGAKMHASGSAPPLGREKEGGNSEPAPSFRVPFPQTSCPTKQWELLCCSHRDSLVQGWGPVLFFPRLSHP